MGCGSSSDARPMVGVAPAAQPGPGQQKAVAAGNGTATNTTAASSSSSSSDGASTTTPGNAAASAAQQVKQASLASPQVHQGLPRMGPPVPVSVLTDSYKASHYLMYPEAKLMVAYGEFRGAFNKDPDDTRFVFYGIRYIIENFVAVPWTERDVEQADMFYQTHNAGFTPFPFPKDLFLKFVHQNKGYMPVRIEALQEGTVANVHVPVYQIFASDEYSRLITFLETILTQVWYPSTVATLSRRTRDLIEQGFEETAEEKDHWMVDFKLHDFGFRGCTCVEQSILGGTAHLLNFAGSDTMPACYYAQMYLNNGKPVASSIPATEHSVMTSWPNERLAMENMIDKFGGANAVFAIVMDSYDYNNALTKVLPAVAERHKQKGGTLVLRPDSGDPVECILSALEAGEKNFPTKKNAKGFKVIEGLAAIQGDGINYNTVRGILNATKEAGFSAQNVAFGMGGGLLQKVNRDTMSFATKLSYIVYMDGTAREVMKRPKTESGKISLPGILKVRRDGGKLIVEPRTPEEKPDYETNEVSGEWEVWCAGPEYAGWDWIADFCCRSRSLFPSPLAEAGLRLRSDRRLLG
jgi:nicotinic acid phosphoribosyltransferase